MTGLESIIKSIEEEAAIISKERILAAEKKVEELKEEAKKEEEKIKKDGEKERELLLHNSKKQADSAALVAKKNKILAAKQKMIIEVILQAKESILSLPEEEYFDLILKLLAPFDLGQGGSLCFNQRDLNRLPSYFLETLDRRNEESKDNKLTIAKEPVNITGGFLLEQGNITHNLSIEALFEEKRDQLLEPIASLLFASEEEIN
ncbi:V-type ATP synthase subunit E family protein [Lachnoclostridium phytofermentans]|uniref:H+transporting two-sector ATPase E subunit n=1 Tax=Lachnoclostridium phytofermentans (strain ATCC 700394 / DSM 18823 / ISDg) TaxID=357809 RepID=A9KQV3_LACP7|nr:V-type ATP synthase subunit E family protein [Lachnoclostridium phytofermentans]ABX43432.1 H+transporting two-sector ATPase E subunit [Lachnoclostridium phytofermentans ISDg]